ncbi:MAG TPA: hypothetical protein VHN98_11735 [Acidimicrobiales bacterium]|nr:hypothetical protein [Acidimicrobiales bacterium]
MAEPHGEPTFELTVRADGDNLVISLSGAVDSEAGRCVREVCSAARRLGIPHRVAVTERDGTDRA